MRRFSIVSVFTGCLYILLTPLGTSVAQGYGEALLNAISYKLIPQGAAYSVQALDNSDQSLELIRDFERILRNKGYAVHDDSPFVITFEIRNEMGSYKTRNKRAVLELDAHGGREGGEDAKMRFNLFDSNSGGVFNEGKGETTIMSKSQYRLDVSIDSRSNGKRHWQAWSVADLDRADGTELIRAMLPEVIDKIGHKVKSHIFEIQ